jgi:hypothetical protein
VNTTNDWKFAFRTLGYPQQERAVRRTPSGLVAMHGSVTAPKLGRIKIISKNGIFLQTEERWPIGEVISVSLQREGPQQIHSEFEIDVQAQVASYGKDGVGLGFVLPIGLNKNFWDVVIRNADARPETEEVSFLFRVVRTILFVCRLCPSITPDDIQALGKELDEARTRSAIEIALKAEMLLAQEPDADDMHAHPQIVASILRNGSWSGDNSMQQLWAGLLVSSCTAEGTNESNRDFIELLVQVTETQARILVAGCKRATESMSGLEGERSKEIIITPEEMIQISGMYDAYRIATEVSYLFNFGLLEKVFDFTTYTSKEKFDITPSKLGLELFKVCRGR